MLRSEILIGPELRSLNSKRGIFEKRAQNRQKKRSFFAAVYFNRVVGSKNQCSNESPIWWSLHTLSPYQNETQVTESGHKFWVLTLISGLVSDTYDIKQNEPKLWMLYRPRSEHEKTPKFSFFRRLGTVWQPSCIDLGLTCNVSQRTAFCLSLFKVHLTSNVFRY